MKLDDLRKIANEMNLKWINLRGDRSRQDVSSVA